MDEPWNLVADSLAAVAGHTIQCLNGSLLGDITAIIAAEASSRSTLPKLLKF